MISPASPLTRLILDQECKITKIVAVDIACVPGQRQRGGQPRVSLDDVAGGVARATAYVLRKDRCQRTQKEEPTSSEYGEHDEDDDLRETGKESGLVER